MSDLIKNMISQITDKNYKGAQATFEDVMTSKIGDAFDHEKINLAASIFNGIDVDDLVTESYDDEDDEDEELDEENLSELSKKTLGSYVRKAAGSAADNAHELGKKRADADDVDRFTNRHMNNKYAARDDIKKAIGADSKSISKVSNKAGRRLQGIDRASARLEK